MKRISDSPLIKLKVLRLCDPIVNEQVISAGTDNKKKDKNAGDDLTIPVQCPVLQVHPPYIVVGSSDGGSQTECGEASSEGGVPGSSTEASQASTSRMYSACEPDGLG